MIKPHHSTALSTLIFLCSAVCFAVAERESRAATAFGAVLISGVAALAMYLSERQRQRFALSPEQLSEVEMLAPAGRTTAAVRRVRDSVATDSGYTSHSRA